MNKEIYLCSEDKKYKCAVELTDSCDRFGCPDHSVIILTEERLDGTYVIAQAKDRILETEKDKQIAELQKQLEEKDDKLKSQPAEICQKLIDMLTDRAELIDVGTCAEFMFTVYDLRESVKELLEDY